MKSIIKRGRRNKKGEGIMSVVIIIGFLFLILLVGLGAAFGGVAIQWVFTTATPELSNLGMVGNTNLTSIGETVLTPINGLVNSFSWLSGVIYIMALLGMVGLSIGFRITGNKWLMAFFFMCVLILIIASIFISNIYETFYNDGSEIGISLHNYGLLSFLILYSPMVMCVIAFVCGIIMFTGDNMEQEI